MTASAAPSVFISYAVADRDRAETLERTLRERGVRTSLDVLDETRERERSGIGEGDVLPDSVLQELDQADHVVVLLTAAAAGDPWVALEAGMAKDFGVDVVYLRSGEEDAKPPSGETVVDDVNGVVERVTHGETDTEPYQPRGIRLRPGRWSIDGHGMARQVQLDVTLNDDGTLTGTYLEHGVTKDVTGDWQHDDASDIVQLRIASSFGSRSHQDTLRIQLLSEDDEVITGEDAYTIGLGALTYTIRRAPT